MIEVIAGTTLMAVLLVSLLMAYGAHAAQIRRSHQRLVAVDVLDRLLSQRIVEGGTLMPAPQVMAIESGLYWRTAEIQSPVANRLKSKVIRWQISDAPNAETPLAMVDLLIPAMVDQENVAAAMEGR